MSIQAISWVLENSRSHGSARLVLISLANHAGDSSVSWPSSRTIASEAGVKSHVTVLAALRTLADLGEIEMVEQGTSRRSTRYRLTLRSDSDHGSGQRLTSAVSPERPQRSVQADQNHQEPSVTIKPPAAPPPVEAIFVAWTEATGKTKTKLDPKRRRKIEQALALGYEPCELIDAVRGWTHSPHHAGQNERNTVYNDLELLLRDASHIETFRDLERNISQRPSSSGGPGPARPKALERCATCGCLPFDCACP